MARREAPLLDTPAAVTVLPAELLDAQHATLLIHAALNDPSVAESYAPAGYYDSINIRGFELDVWNSYRINGKHNSRPPWLENKGTLEVTQGAGYS
ncbi:MAG: Plug domain-containing protein [Betaproteobacteria bacterium]|nr:Plug domain-containing protein [Betaproteobacteria bacterium]